MASEKKIVAKPKRPRQLLLFPRPPRRSRQILMHVTDAGIASDDAMIVILGCSKCGYCTDWQPSRGLARDKRGTACPGCNGQAA